MACLFGCFQLKDDPRRSSARLVSEPPPAITGEPVVNRNRNRNRKRLGALLQEKEGSVCDEKNYNIKESAEQDFDSGGLRDEAKFLKACGTLPATPAEIRKAKQFSADQNSEPSKFHSWLPDTSFEKLNLDTPPNQLLTPVKLHDEWVTESGPSDCSPSSCITSGQNPPPIPTSTTGNSDAGNVGMDVEVRNSQTASEQCKYKSVQFQGQSDASSFSANGYSEISCQSSNRSGSVGSESVSKASPYPTPVQLSDDMHTPGTAFPSYIREMGNGKNPRIRSQYVYSVLNPVENSSQWNKLKEEDTNSNQLSSSLIESLEHKTAPHTEAGTIQGSVKDIPKVEASLSSWLKPVPTNGNNQRTVSFASEKVYFGKNLGDRPIIGMVAAHWSEDEAPRVPPKWWDGNGIPNSTTKYKEDQKVSWHATPFEERLEKALSEESSLSQRKNVSGTTSVSFNDSEECDTAISQLKSSTNYNTVVSC